LYIIYVDIANIIREFIHF